MSRRNVPNRGKIEEGRKYVYQRWQEVDVRGNRVITTDLDGDDVAYMDCVARIYVGDRVVAQGQYTASDSTHAELNAMSQYYSLRRRGTITRIEISSPPCKNCAYVLELLGELGKVHTNKKICKAATSAWQWPESLRRPDLFNEFDKTNINQKFNGSNLEEDEVFRNVVEVVKTGAYF